MVEGEYLAKGIIESRFDYVAVTTSPTYSKFKVGIDAILVAEGRQDLIVVIAA